jgi:hypothetical protein
MLGAGRNTSTSVPCVLQRDKLLPRLIRQRFGWDAAERELLARDSGVSPRQKWKGEIRNQGSAKEC